MNWEEAHRRIEAAGRIISGEGNRSSAQIREVLQERARILARPITAPAREDAIEVVTFAVAGEWRAVESRYMIGIFRPNDVAPLPGVEAPALGLTAWRGEILTILDFRAADAAAAVIDGESRILVLGEKNAAFGVLADAVGKLLSIAAADLSPIEGERTAKSVPLRGITAEAVLVLDAAELLRIHR